MSPRVFLLSPARVGGERMGLVLSPRARFDLARAVQGTGAPLGEVFRFASGLYFRGKLAYALAFGRPPRDGAAALVIVPGAGLLPAETPIRAEHLRAFAEVPVDAREPRFRGPLERAAEALADALGPHGEVVLLGSVAAAKYVDPLLPILGGRLLFPVDFVGRGDMSRGGLLLRAVRAGVELPYVPVAGAVRHGARPPRLAPLPRDAQRRDMANDHSGKNVGQRTGRPEPHPTGERVADASVPREDKSEPESGPRRDPLPDEWQDRGSDLPGLRKKIR